MNNAAARAAIAITCLKLKISRHSSVPSANARSFFFVRTVVLPVTLWLCATAAYAQAQVIVSASAISTSQVSVSASVGASGSCPRVVRWTSGTGQVPVYTTCTGNEFPTSFGFTDSSLAPNTTYFYCGMDGALDEVGNYTPYSGCNNTATVATFGPPSAPSSLNATGAGTQINLSWADGSNNESNFLIERKTGSGGTFAQIASVGANVVTYANTGLAPDTAYFYRVRSSNAYGSSSYTSTAAASTAPAAPTSLSATGATGTQIALTWTDASSTETGFKIERKSGSGGTYAQIATVAANVASYTDISASSGTSYFYRVRSTSANGDSSYSNEANAALNTAPTIALTSPTSNATFTAPASIAVTANAADSDGSIAKVEFFDGTTLVGTVTAAPFTVNLQNVGTGNHAYSAKATDNLGLATTSGSISIIVGTAHTLAFIEVDHLNTPRAVYDASQQLRWKWDQAEPFGVNTPNEDPSSLGAYELSVRFAGQYADKESNLSYNVFRDYDSNLGRYSESDPLGIRAGLDTYAYVAGGPVSRVDPLGLFVPIVHREMTEQALVRGSCNMDGLPQAVVDVDKNTQDGAQAAVHDMRTKGRTVEEGAAAVKEYLGPKSQSCDPEDLAKVIHLTQDGFSPSHRGLQEWSGHENLLQLFIHIIPDTFVTTATWEASVAATTRLIEDFKTRCPCKCR